MNVADARILHLFANYKWTGPADPAIRAAARLARGPEFFAEDEVEPARQAFAAIFLRPMWHEQAFIGENRAEFAREGGLLVAARAVHRDVIPIGWQLACQHSANALAIGVLFRRPVEFH